MRSVDNVAIAAFLFVGLGYLVGSASALLQRPGEEPSLADVLVEGFVAVAWSTIAWRVTEAVSPGSNYESRVALHSNQVLIVWQSVALWAGLGVVAGQAAPVFRRFRGSSGFVGTAGLLLAHTPPLLFPIVIAHVVASLVVRRQAHADAVAIATLPAVAWVTWVLDTPAAWGVILGPEVALWALVLAGVLAVRWWATNGDPVAT